MNGMETLLLKRSDIARLLSPDECIDAIETANDIVIFDSTGMALQDVAASSIVFRKASATSAGLKMNFGE
jgi:ornithine cyclodeaminase/alanine dehydrogenase-like protein (mu-crystallin family)